ncbi:MAG: DNA polymerase Y family protein [Myxococcota bacterium]
MARIACLLVPDLPLRAELRVHPEQAGRAWGVTSGPDARAQVIAASPEARAAGVAPPCSLARARSICPEIDVRVTSLAEERAARAALLDAAFACSPRAEAVPRAGGVFAAEAAVWVDATGIEALFRSEAAFATRLAACAAALGLPGAVAVASSRAVSQLVARALVRRPPAPRVEGEWPVRALSPGEERAFLAPLPVDLLDPDDRLSQALTRFGIRTVRDLLRLPRGATARRLGPEWLQLVARARGEETDTPLAEARDRRIVEHMELDHAVDRLEPLRFVLRGLLSRLLERLALRGWSCGPIDLELGLVGGAREQRRVAPAAPTSDPKVWLRLFGLALEERPPEAPVESLHLGAEGAAFRRDQLDLFRPRGPDPASLDRTLSELESLCGVDRVGSPDVADDHHPGAWALRPFQPPRIDPGSRDRSPGPALAVRALRPPVSARVRVGHGRPEWVESAVARGRVVHASGPWRTTGRWWSDERYALDHYDVQVEDGTVVRLAYDFVGRAWHVDGLYD